MITKTLTTTALIAGSLVLNARADITTSLLGDWSFTDGSGSSTAADSSGNNRAGTLTGFSDATYTTMWTNVGRFGTGLIFNQVLVTGDTNDYVSVPDTGSVFDFNGGREMTLAAWINCSVSGSSQSNGACIICKGDTALQQYGLYISNGVISMIVRNSAGTGTQITTSTVNPAANTWYHVVGIWGDNVQINQIYINGQFNATHAGAGFTTSEETTALPLTIGASESGTFPVEPFQGTLNDVRIYSRVLAASDIYQLYTNGFTAANAPAVTTQPRGVAAYLGDSPVFSVAFNPSTTLVPVTYQWLLNGTNVNGGTNSTLIVTNAQTTNAGTYTVQVGNVAGTNTSSNAVLTLSSLPAANTNSGLAGYWKFDDGTGSSTAADSSGNGDTGELSGFTDLTYTSMWTNGLFNGALAFNGDGSKSNVVAIPAIGTPAPPVLDFSTNLAFSLSAWVNGSATQTSGAAIIAKGTGGGGEEYVLDIFGGDYRFYVRDTNSVVYTAQTSIAPSGFWQHVAAVLNATNGMMDCYVNGLLAAETVAPFSLQTNSHEVSIGNRQAASASYGLDFTGILDDVKIYNRALTSADVAALYEAAAAPLVITWPATNYVVDARANALLAPTVVGGVPPYTYQWQQNGTNVNGATNSSISLPNAGPAAAGSYDVIVSNSPYVSPVTSSTITVEIESYLTFNTNGTTWMNQGSSTSSALWLGTNTVQMTPLTASESNSIFYDFPLNVGAFQASFNYQITAVPGGTTGPGDGATFCIQNDPRGAAALGSDEVELGVGNINNNPGGLAITPSVEFALDIADASDIEFDTNGLIGTAISALPVAMTNLDLINVFLTYQSNVLTITLTDTNASPNTTFTDSTNLNITNILGSTYGYVGFTAGTGAGYAAQRISAFSFESLEDAPPLVLTPPQSITNLPAGETAAFSVGIVGSVPISYQWQLNGTNLNNGPSFTGSGAIISGATTSNLTVAGALTADAGTYTIVATNGYLPNASASATLTVSDLPAIEFQSPTNMEVFAGFNPTLIMSAAGLPPLDYQWTSNGTPIAGATGSSYTPIGAQGSTITYGGSVSNVYGTNFINPVTVTVLADPTAPYPLAVLASHPMDYWRLDEASGTVGYDYVSGNNGIYSNVSLDNVGYTINFNPQSDPTETSAYFGTVATNNSYMGSVPALVNFGTPTNTSAEFSVEAWLDANGSLPSGTGLVSLGYGNGGEQFCLDLDTAANDLRFFVRNAGGTVYTALSSFVPANGYWHHVVGVCDEANSSIYLYADGQLIASNAVPAGSGLLASSQSLAIGSRQSGLNAAYNDQLSGEMDDVSLYNYALSSNTVLAHYLAAGIAPFNLQALPANLTTNQNTTATFTATVTGTAPLSYFWTDGTNNNALISTNAVLSITNVQGPDYYQVLVTNLYGTATASVSLNVNTGPVSIPGGQLPAVIQVPPGYPVSLAVGVSGTAPFNYQWYLNTSTLIPGATNAIYNFLSFVGTNTYNLWVTNQSGGTQTASSSMVTVEVGAVPPVFGFGDGTSWQPNGASFNGNPASLELTDGNPSEARSAFYDIPQYIEGFLASFTYTPANGGTATRADGAAFVLQNSSSGLTALGAAGGDLGYFGITPSVAFELDIYSSDAGGTGINWETNGFTAAIDGVANGGTGSVNINSLDPIGVTLFYNYGAGQLDVDLIDQTTSASYRTNYHVGDLGELLGSDLAYVGFTGGTGGSDSVQTITNFNYSYSQTPTLSIAHSGGNVVLSWPGPTIPGNFVLQQSSAVNGPWSNVGTATNFPTVGNDQYQVTVAPAGNAQYYRLILPNP